MAIRDYARAMRRAPAASEARIWSWLRNRKFAGDKFRRQHPIGGSILDFYSAELKLAIETDGKQHDLPGVHECDDERTLHRKRFGVEALRIPNEVLASDSEPAAEWIRLAIEQRRR